MKKVTGNYNPAQLQEKASTIIQAKARVAKTLKLGCLGDLRCKVGNSVLVNINALQALEMPEMQFCVIEQCTHTFKNEYHTMQMDVRVTA